jgi:calpain-15
MEIKLPSGEMKKVNCLFDSSIAPSDICQGVLGNCWLIAAFATLCERPSFIQNCFLTPVFNRFGKYKVRLFDSVKKKYISVTIDDLVPCDPKTRLPLFTQLQSNEIWPLLLEKAYAKFKGSYSALKGLTLAFALIFFFFDNF